MRSGGRNSVGEGSLASFGEGTVGREEGRCLNGGWMRLRKGKEGGLGGETMREATAWDDKNSGRDISP